MAEKNRLRINRTGTVINATSQKQEKDLGLALSTVQRRLEKDFPGIVLDHQSQWLLATIVDQLKIDFPKVDFYYNHETSSMRPDGGILSIVDKNKKKYPILIAEKKNQGTNEIRAKEGMPKQAKGNAIERLGKNVIGFRTALLTENIFPFVCFGDGCDFADDSSILDRVVTIGMFGALNKEYVHNTDKFNRGTFYFRVKSWSEDEMAEKCYSIAKASVLYYFSKYKQHNF